MAAIRMEENNKITVLVNPWENKQKEKSIKGVFLTRHYENPSGVLPEEHLFVSDNEDWFYWLGYNTYWMREVTDQEVHNIKKVINYAS